MMEPQQVAVPGLGMALGALEGSTRVFKGLPFAHAPRFAAPVPVSAWPAGGHDATAEQLAAWQSLQPQAETRQTEDCLTVTVRSPVGASGLPVMCWIHGGNHQDGRAEEPNEPRANALPSKGVVLVKIQYRLGLFGYFAHPELPDTNFGTMDTITALEWIRDNIAVFGGDPQRVTIFGVSAGGDAVAHLLINQRAEGLFHRAIMQSANVTHQFVHHRTAFLGYMPAVDAGTEFASRLVGAEPGQLDRLRAMPASDLAMAYSQAKEADSNWQGFWPNVDGAVIPLQPFAAFAEGRHHRVPIIVGSNADEGQNYTEMHRGIGGPSAENMGWVHPHPLLEHPAAGPYPDAYGDRREELAAMYPGLAHDKPRATSDLVSDQLFAHKARWYAQHARSPAWLYLFSRQQPAPPWGGATHGGEVVFVLGHEVGEPRCPEDDVLADRIQQLWVAFARDGDPNSAGCEELPPWPEYAIGKSEVLMTLDHTLAATAVVRAPLLDIHDIWLRRTCRQLPRQSGGGGGASAGAAKL